MFSSALLLLLASLTLADRAEAQVAGRKLGACEERLYLSKAQLELAIGFSLLGNGVEARFRSVSGDPVEIAGMQMCARSIRSNVCTDKLLMGFIDPVGAVAGGALGLAAGDSLLGGLLGSGAVGMVKGVTDLATCNRSLATLEPSARSAFGSGRIDANALREGEVTRMIVDSARTGRIPAEDASRMIDYIEGASSVLAQ